MSERSAGRILLRGFFRLLWMLMSCSAVVILPIALIVRLTVRDHFVLSGIIFYATPWPVLWAMALVCAWRWRKSSMRHWLAGVTIVCLGMWLWTSLRVGPTERPDGSFRISYWNVARPEVRLGRVLAEADRWRADFLVFGEHKRFTTPPEWAAHFAPRTVTPLGRELLLVSQGPMKRIDGGSLGGRGGCQISRVKIQGREVCLLMVDIDSRPDQSRKPAFDRLREIVVAYSAVPLVVLGDFNTPADSVHFDRLRELLTEAFDASGHGYTPTWPMPLPVMQLDQIWSNKHLRCVRAEHFASLYSDHRAIVADFEFAQ